ncbi:AAA family ATPase [Sphaerisporangium sp. TRM90804]|uniref:AAA family ATPase n=1 Tax=Sphaerisporangium sp. TRM90804 TaxID=3031113 RepID=UPI00244B13FE|nr:AAA family ATPase [Sphaerisporangium sp. TRM90804]MDH2425658.1 AAA family ATPase [Sphaerisporangium sp. TRM90804]
MPARGWPPFVREIDATLAVQAQYVLYGNLRDHFLVRPDGGPPQLQSLRDLLWGMLEPNGYRCLLYTDPVDGLAVHPRSPDATEAAARLLGGQSRGAPGGGNPPSLARLRADLAAFGRPQQPEQGRPPVRAAFVIDYASQLAVSPENLDPAERDFFLACLKLSRTAAGLFLPGAVRPGPLYNPIIWLVEREQDLPSWFTAANARVRSIGVPSPDFGDRQETARLLAGSFRGEASAPEVCDAFAEQAEGLALQQMVDITRLARDRGLGFERLPDAVRTYKLGVLDNPWRRGFLRGRIKEGETSLPARVVGQDAAVTKTLDILKRAALGLSGAQAAQSSSRPRGVLFFAGPTGVGKTELAKRVAALVFGDESAYLRFDMSEFSAEHAGDRLIGAPPGYTGHEAGGELTNAVRQQPFRVVLFDEIEKAHPRILDKFLQVLEDGRLTDGRGTTTHFSECVLIFTSNLGVSTSDGAAVRPGMPYEEIERVIKAAVAHHFTSVLKRPELLNRLGDNIVVFDFIGEEAAARIFDLQLANILRTVGDQHAIEVRLKDDVRATLLGWCTSDLEKGGRGIGAALESLFVNPLARALFDLAEGRPDTLTVSGMRRDGPTVTLETA